MGLHRSSTRLVVAGLAAFALLATACGDDGDTTSSESTTTTASDASSTTEAPPEDDATTTTAEPVDEVVLTDSAPGVTATSIKIGVPYVDTTAIGQSPSHDAAAIWEAAADTINADGGVLGRMIELVTVSVDPTDTVAQDEACVQLTEDEMVFAVMGVLLREAPLCYTQNHETVAINSYETAGDVYERSTAPLVGVLPLAERRLQTQIDTLLEAGTLDGAKVALSATPTTLELAQEMQGLLEAEGVEVVSLTQFLSASADQLALDAEMDVNVEKWKSDGANAVVAVPGAAVPTTGALSRNGWDGVYVITDASGTDPGLLDGVGYTTDSLVGSVAVVAPTEADLYDAGEAGVPECVTAFEDAYDDDPEVEVRPEDPTTGGIGVIVRACQALDLFKAIAEAAGPDLTNESFDAAADEIGEVAVTGVIAGSLGPDKRDFVDAGAVLFEWDEELQRFVLA